MTSLETIFGGLIIAIASGLVGAWLSTRSKVDCRTCLERRAACMEIIDQKFELFKGQLKDLKEMVEKIWKKLENSNITMIF